MLAITFHIRSVLFDQFFLFLNLTVCKVVVHVKRYLYLENGHVH